MRRIFFAIVFAGLLAVPAASFAHGDGGRNPAHHAAVQQCKAERAQLGRAAFQLKYGKPHAFRKCVAAHGGLQNANDIGEQEGNHQGKHKRHHHRGHKEDQNQGNHHHRHHKDRQGGDDSGD